MTFKTSVPVSATAAGLFLHGLCGVAHGATKEAPSAPDICGAEAQPMRGRTLEPTTQEHFDEMKENLEREMARVPPAFWTSVGISNIYCVGRIIFEQNPKLKIDAVYSSENCSIAFTYGEEHTIFHELGHAMDHVRIEEGYDGLKNCDTKDTQWDNFYRKVCAQVSQKAERYLDFWNSAWTCTRDENGKWPEWMTLEPTQANKIFGEYMSTHFDGCYAASAGYEDRQEIFRAIMEPNERRGYLFSDDGPSWEDDGKCKCKSCKRPFAREPTMAKRSIKCGEGNRFAVLRAKSWWQYFTINQNTLIFPDDEARRNFWLFRDEDEPHCHVLKPHMLFLDPVRFTVLDEKDIDELVTQFQGRRSINIVNFEDDESMEAFRRKLKTFQIFNIAKKDLGVPMRGGIPERSHGSSDAPPSPKDTMTGRIQERGERDFTIPKIHVPGTTPQCDEVTAAPEEEPKQHSSGIRSLSPAQLNMAIVSSPRECIEKAIPVLEEKINFMQGLRETLARRRKTRRLLLLTQNI